jgi:hypothetical protein
LDTTERGRSEPQRGVGLQWLQISLKADGSTIVRALEHEALGVKLHAIGD